MLWPFDAHNATLLNLAWSPDGTRLLTDFGDVWDVESGKILVTLKKDKYLRSMMWSPDGTYLATTDGTVRIWDSKTYRLLNILSADSHAQTENLTWSADSKLLAGTSTDGQRNEVNVWDIATTKQIAILNSHSGYVYALAWSPDNKSLASGDDHIHVWNTTNWQQRILIEQDGGPVDDLAWNRDGTLASLAQNEINRWDTNTGQRLNTISNDDYVFEGPISWSPDSRQIAIGVRNTIQLRDGITGALVKKIDTKQAVKLLTWNPTSPLVATSDGLTSLQIWNTDVEQLVKTLASSSTFRWSPDGARLAVLSGVATVKGI